MGFNPVNLAFRFALELLGLVGLFRLGLEAGSGIWRWAIAFALVLVAMTVWANFRVPGDGSARGDAPFAVPGWARLGIELAVLGAGAFGWFYAGPPWFAWVYLVALALHHLVSYDRIGWLLRVGSDGEPSFVN